MQLKDGEKCPNVGYCSGYWSRKHFTVTMIGTDLVTLSLSAQARMCVCVVVVVLVVMVQFNS